MSRLERLKRRPEFLRVASRGCKAATPGLVLQALERRGEEATALPSAGEAVSGTAVSRERGVRVGFTASRKVGKAVERNRARRRLREAVEEVFPSAARPGRDYVVVARRGTLHRPWPDLLEDLRSALGRVESSERREPGRKRRHHSRRGGTAMSPRDGTRKRTEA